MNPRGSYVGTLKYTDQHYQIYRAYYVGGMMDLSIARVRLAQVSYDPDINGDSKVDLVLNKPAVAVTMAKAEGVSPYSTARLTIRLKQGSSTLEQFNVEMAY